MEMQVRLALNRALRRCPSSRHPALSPSQMGLGGSRRSLLTMGTSTNALLGPGSSPGGSPLLSPHGGPLAGTLTLDTAAGSFGSDGPLTPTHSSPSAPASGAPAPVALTPAQLRQRALEFEKEVLSDIEEVTVQVRHWRRSALCVPALPRPSPQAERAVGAGGSAMVQAVLTEIQVGRQLSHILEGPSRSQSSRCAAAAGAPRSRAGRVGQGLGGARRGVG